VFGMPRAAHLAGAVDKLVPLWEIPEAINRFR
jgi:chemotaxis response regulator CheB